MTENQLKEGMYLTNDGPGMIPLYDKLDGTGQVVYHIAPGQLIGQIVDRKHGPSGLVIDFTSDLINSNISIWKQAGAFLFTPFYVFNWLTGKQNWACGVRFADLKNNVRDAQVAQQLQAIAEAEADGFSIKNGIKEFTEGAADIVSSTFSALVPWKVLLGLGALYILTQPKTAQKWRSKI